MQNVVLTIHLILALLLTGVVLLQRSEGGGLGMGGGGGAGGVMSGRQAANVFTRLTWLFGIGLFATSIALTVIAAREASTGSIIDQLGGSASTEEQAPATNLPGLGTYTPPPTTSGQPVAPPAPEAPAAAEPAAPAAEEPAAPAAEAPAAEAPAQPVAPPAAEPAAPAETPAEPAQPATN